MSPSLTGDPQAPSSTSFLSSLSIWHFLQLPNPALARWAEHQFLCTTEDLTKRADCLSPECPLDTHSTQLWLSQHSSGTGKWAGMFLSSLLAVGKDISEQKKWRCNLVHVFSWQTEETPTSIEFWMDYPDISLDSNTGLENQAWLTIWINKESAYLHIHFGFFL